MSNTGYGHGDGPYSGYPAQATTQEATHGTAGSPATPQVIQMKGRAKAGASFVDFLSTWTALFAIGAALRYRSRTGLGQWVDMGMYQAGVMFLSEYVLDAIANGREGGASATGPVAGAAGCYPARGDDQWITLSGGRRRPVAGLLQGYGAPGLASDERFASVIGRRENTTHWTKSSLPGRRGRDRYDTMHGATGGGHSLRAGADWRDIHYDPHFKSRNFLERAQYPPERKLASGCSLSRPYKFSKSPLHIQGPSPAFGQHNEPALRELLGVSEETYQQLVEDVVDHDGADHRGAVAGDAAAGGAGAGHHRRLGPGLSRAAGTGVTLQPDAAGGRL